MLDPWDITVMNAYCLPSAEPRAAGCDLNDGGRAASAKVRQARAELTALADRQHLLRRARSNVLALAGQAAQVDTQQDRLFANRRTSCPAVTNPTGRFPALSCRNSSPRRCSGWSTTAHPAHRGGHRQRAGQRLAGRLRQVVHRRQAAHISARAYAGDLVRPPPSRPAAHGSAT